MGEKGKFSPLLLLHDGEGSIDDSVGRNDVELMISLNRTKHITLTFHREEKIKMAKEKI